MRRRLYIETNFVMAFAKGQDRANDDVLALAEERHFDLIMPEACIMEAFKAWEREKVRTTSLTRRLLQQIDEYARREGMLGASAAAILDNARVQADKQLNTVRTRAANCIERISVSGRTIPLSARWVRAGAQPVVIPAEADDMILATVIDHAQAEPVPEAGLLTNNRRDFGDAAVQTELKQAGLKLFFQAKYAVAWLRSGTLPSKDMT